MASTFMNRLGLGARRPEVVSKPSPVRALPASWYTSEDMYQLERRAIFTSKWMMITHRVRFANSGDQVTFECAGYEFIIARDSQRQFRAFHSNQDSKKIHLKVDDKGFIWVNLDSSDNPEPWETDFADVDMQERYNQYTFDDYIFDHEWQIDDVFNWKLCADNFNECYHCPTSHPTIPALLDVESLKSQHEYGWIKHTSAQTAEQERDGLQISSTYHFPNVSASILQHYIMLQRFIPHSAHTSTMHYQIFRNKNSPVELFDLVDQLYHQVMSEDKALCAGAHKNLARGVLVNGEMHPRLESAPLFFQAKTRETIKAHVEKEKAAGRQIWPAGQPTTRDLTSVMNDDEKTHPDVMAIQPANLTVGVAA